MQWSILIAKKLDKYGFMCINFFVRLKPHLWQKITLLIVCLSVDFSEDDDGVSTSVYQVDRTVLYFYNGRLAVIHFRQQFLAGQGMY